MRGLLIAIIFICELFSSPTSAQTGASSYTVWKSISEAKWPPNSTRRALIVGNTVYRKGASDDDLPPARFGNAASTCDDAYLVARSLTRAGWHADEIALGCDQTSDQLNGGLQHLMTAPTRRAVPGQITIVYLAGHGAQVGGRDYFFGVNAKPDFDSAADEILDTDGAVLFGDEATNVVGVLGQLGTTARSPVLFVIDACRDDPVFEKARKLVAQRFKERAPGLRESEITGYVRGVFSASAIGRYVQPEGVKMVFASSKGATVTANGGGAGRSRLAAAFADHLVRNPRLVDVISGTAIDVIEATKGLSDDQRQFPDSPGNLLGNPCVTACSLAGLPASAIDRDQGRPRFIRTSFTIPATRTSAGIGSAGQLGSEADRSQTLLDRSIGGRLARTIEVFWCAKDAAADAGREASALAFARTVVAKAGDPALADVGIVRATRLSVDENALAANRSNANGIRYDAADALLATALRTSAPDLALAQTSIGVEGYVPVYFCRGTYDGPQAARLFTQAPNVAGRGAAAKVIANLASEFPDIKFIRTVEIRADNSPAHTQIRYYDPARLPVATCLARRAKAVLGVDVTPKLFARLASPSLLDLFELWIGQKDAIRLALDPPKLPIQPRACQFTGANRRVGAG